MEFLEGKYHIGIYLNDKDLNNINCSISIVFQDLSNDDNKQPLTGARGTYHSLLTTLDSKQEAPHFQTPATKLNDTKPKHSEQKEAEPQQKVETHKTEEKQPDKHARKASLNKSFDAFLQRTNDEWSDDIHEPSTEEAPVIIDHNAIEKASKAVETISSVLPTISEKPQLKKKKSTNPNGVKDHVQNLILGKHFVV